MSSFQDWRGVLQPNLWQKSSFIVSFDKKRILYFTILLFMRFFSYNNYQIIYNQAFNYQNDYYR